MIVQRGSRALALRRGSLLVALAILVVDQLTKWWALERLDDGRIIDVVWTLRLRLVFNEGMSFSLGQDLGWLVGLIGIGVVVVLLVWSGRLGSSGQRVAVGAVIGGAVGNLVDRIFRADDGPLSGAVVDFLDLQWWPVFNVADMALVLGVISLMLLLAIEEHQAEGTESMSEPEQPLDGSPGPSAPRGGASERSGASPREEHEASG